ncbi:unnamed protein product (macronuclear) [Paramecium tetraurelia]|uniref:AAA+ ATPase domain-containing protein n=1 Tax=Paramecium tetraurelia TaxID=5888 RepID=A0CDI3_PARTE|nr:uncharacterized protein GSPATT00007061001 [Paramecium tetraurelia]CAK68850.1 unnamed protein product [Paramecium tetraurelia]|eukprot:XP_001436247.1 hypothetical protein (macronuclear) [Paramecium tetraurelia strain d4-2]
MRGSKILRALGYKMTPRQAYQKSFSSFLNRNQITKDELIKLSDQIPGQQFKFNNNHLKLDQQDQTLLKLKSDFMNNRNDYSKAFSYMEYLNQQENYKEAIQFYDSLDRNQSFQLQSLYTQSITKYLQQKYHNYRTNTLFYTQFQLALLLLIAFQYLQYYKTKMEQQTKMDEQEYSKDKQDRNNEYNQNLPQENFRRIEHLLNVLKNHQKVQQEQNIPTKFEDVLGIDEFREELEEILQYLKNPDKFTQSGAKLPKGILLVGPPGSGKTLLARALAGEAGCSFFQKSGSEFDEMFVGVGAQRVRELFQNARKSSPSIIFIDEIDSIGGRRKMNDPTASRDTINQILTEMDGFKQNDGIIVIGATNFEQVLDPVLKRAGRFDKIISIPLPDVKGRQKIFAYYLNKVKYNKKNVDPLKLAQLTTGFSGAEIQNIVNLAILNAIKNKREQANSTDFEFAIDRSAMGVQRKQKVINEKDKLITAFHEGGHTVTNLLTDGAPILHKVSILPRGEQLGYTSMIPEFDITTQTRKTILAQIDVAMGGRAAEDLFLGRDEITSGCSQDLAQATTLAYQYVKQLGMNENSLLISIDQSSENRTSTQFDYLVDMQVKKVLDDSYARVKRLLINNEDMLQKVAFELLQKETLSAQEIKKLLNIF